MEKIKSMSLHPLRVEEDFGFQKLVIAEVDKLPLVDTAPGYTAGLKSAVEAFKQAYQQFDTALKAATTVPAAKRAAELDALRDEAWRAMCEYAKASMAFPLADISLTATEVYGLFRKYGDLATLPQTEETGRLHNLLQDLAAVAPARMAAANFKPLLESLQRCEDDYLVAASERAAQEGTVQVGIIKKNRAVADEAYRTLVETVNALAIVNGVPPYTAFINPVNAIIDRQKAVLAARRTANAKKTVTPKDGGTGKGDKNNPYAEELERLAAMIAEYERSSHFPAGSVKFTGLAAGTGDERAYQVYLDDQPADLFWLTVKNGKLTEIEFKIQPGQPGGLETEKIK